MGFFELPPFEPEPEPSPVPEWAGAPRNQIGGPVPTRLLLAQTDDVAVAVLGGAAYPSGFEFVLSIRTRNDVLDSWEEPLWSRGRPRAAHAGLPDDLFRFGVQFSAGRRVTTLSRPSVDDDEPSGPVLCQGGGRGGSGSWDSDYWLWPLPPPGPLAFVCEWPARGIALSRAEVDANLVPDAAKHAETLWPPQPSRGGFTSYPVTARGPAPPELEIE